ncbi:hypothetical protein NDU88_006317 [Pleurodeles waltl]|uniref:Uncharacterized protein n=1 Tax=Pleurodeles waltl TaxID=8319 RepID=A0AAV7X163_PLEWA|nr:hypothetical protein NDU88_006317 [Pleurodeles waltl]
MGPKSCVVLLARGGQLDIQCSRRFQVKSSNSAISDIGCLVKISVCPRSAARREPENLCPASGLPVSRAQMSNPMPKCWCDQGVKRALCGALRDEAQLGREPRRPRSPSAAVVLQVTRHQVLRELQSRRSNPASGKGPRAGAPAQRDPRGVSPTALWQLLAPRGYPQSRAPEVRGRSRRTAPGRRLTSRRRRLGRPPAPPQVLRRPRSHKEGRCIG